MKYALAGFAVLVFAGALATLAVLARVAPSWLDSDDPDSDGLDTDERLRTPPHELP